VFFGLKHLVKTSFCVYAPIIIAVYNYNTTKSRCQVKFSIFFIKFFTTKNRHPTSWVSVKILTQTEPFYKLFAVLIAFVFRIFRILVAALVF